jgi:trk system potassium uptake protein TrkH
MINWKTLLNVLGLLLVLEGAAMLLSIPFSIYYKEPIIWHLLLSAGITAGIGYLAYFFTRSKGRQISKRDGYIIVSSSWIVFSFFGTLPFILTGSIPSFTDAFFETMSGFTTTGASILNDIESLPKGILFWRSMTHWLGGMGIIVLSLAILPILGIGGMQLFVAEVPGPTPDKLHPRIKETAKRLWAIYILLTALETLLLSLGGMSFFDAICHAFATMATGGYSTKQASIAHFSSPFIHYVIIIFMFLAGMNFTLSYFALHLKFDKILKNEEFRFYFLFIAAFTIIIAILLSFTGETSIENSFRDALFQVVSIITTTGFVTADYLNWMPILTALIFVLMFFGGSAGSTGGGVKIMRVVLLLKNSVLELKRLLHPKAIIPVRLNNQPVSQEIITNVLAFVSFYMLILVVSMTVMSTLGYDIESSIGAVVATLGNIGPGIGAVGPVENYHHIPMFGKWFLSALMLIGRLELFTVLVLFSRYFWEN